MKDMYIELSPYQNKYFIVCTGEIHQYFKGLTSYAIIPARLLNLTYAEYLRFAAAKCNGTIIGKTGYPVVYFDTKQDAEKHMKLLYSYWTKGIKKV